MGTEDLVDTKLHEAVRLGDVDEVRIALKEEYDPNQIGIYQWSPLHEACNNGDLDIVEILLQYDGDPNKPDLLCGSTAVHYAASQEHAECLQLLLVARGRHDIVNNDQQTALDVSIGQCRTILQKQKVKLHDNNDTVIGDKNNVTSPPPRDVLLQNILSDTKPHDTNNNRNVITITGSQKSNTTITSSEDLDVTSADAVSVDSASDVLSWNSCSSSSSRPQSRAWGTDRIVGFKKEPVLGHIKMSFEYNSKKQTFKVRVWEVIDLLLPPPETSMISGIYVKSFLQPDKRKQTKRKTEEVKVSSVVNAKNTPNSEIFKPVTFKFQRALEYDGVNQDMVNQKFVEVEVCITQKYTRKSFIIASWNMPVSMATRKLRKERYPLRPCISTSIPSSMRVHNGSDIKTGIALGTEHSQSMTSLDEWATPYAPSEVVVERRGRNSATSIDIEGEPDDPELDEALHQIAVMERKERLEAEAIEMSHMPGSTDDDLDGVSIHSSTHVTEVQIHISPPDTKETKFTDSHKTRSAWCKENSLGVEYGNPGIQENTSPNQTNKYSLSVPSKRSKPKRNFEILPDTPPLSPRDKVVDLDQISITHPGTLEWDDYSEPMSFSCSEVPLGFEDDTVLSPPSPTSPTSPTTPTLPMAIGFALPDVHRSFSRGSSKSKVRFEQTSDKKSSKQKFIEDEESRVGIKPTSFESKDNGAEKKRNAKKLSKEIPVVPNKDEESCIGTRKLNVSSKQMGGSEMVTVAVSNESSSKSPTPSRSSSSRKPRKSTTDSTSVPVHKPLKSKATTPAMHGATGNTRTEAILALGKVGSSSSAPRKNNTVSIDLSHSVPKPSKMVQNDVRDEFDWEEAV